MQSSYCYQRDCESVTYCVSPPVWGAVSEFTVPRYDSFVVFFFFAWRGLDLQDRFSQGPGGPEMAKILFHQTEMEAKSVGFRVDYERKIRSKEIQILKDVALIEELQHAKEMRKLERELVTKKINDYDTKMNDTAATISATNMKKMMPTMPPSTNNNNNTNPANATNATSSSSSSSSHPSSHPSSNTNYGHTTEPQTSFASTHPSHADLYSRGAPPQQVQETRTPTV